MHLKKLVYIMNVCGNALRGHVHLKNVKPVIFVCVESILTHICVKILSGTNTLAYLTKLSHSGKVIITSPLLVDVIKLFFVTNTTAES